MTGLIVSVVGVLTFLFLYWKRLKEDYASQVVFTSALYVLAGFSAGYLISHKFFPIWFFWGGFIGSLAGLLLAVLRFKIKFYETLDASIISFFPMILLMFMSDSAVNSSLVSFIGFVAMLFFIFVYFFLDAKYREFTWYASGKIGFAGLATLGLFFLTRSIVAIFFHDVLSFVDKSEVFVSGSLAFICFLTVYNLGRQE